MQQLFLCFHDISQLTATPTAFVRHPKACALAPLDRQIRTRRKPDWLRQEVLRLKAHMPRAGCRAVAHTFNRLHPSVSVGKTFVADLIASHQHEIAQLRRQIRSAKPRTLSVNNTWAMDMKFFTDDHKTTHAAIGIIDHGSRVALRLQVLNPLCSAAITAASSLLRDYPPLCAALVLWHLRVVPACGFSLGISTTGSPVPYKSLLCQSRRLYAGYQLPTFQNYAATLAHAACPKQHFRYRLTDFDTSTAVQFCSPLTLVPNWRMPAF